MTKAVSAQGEMLFVEKTSGVWTKIAELKNVPEVGTSLGKIDATTLESEVKEYIADIPDQSELTFTFNLMPRGVTDSNLDLIMSMSRSQTYRWKWVAPRLGIQVIWTGDWNYTFGSGAVSSVKEMTITIIPRSAPIEAPIDSTYTVTYNINGGTGTVPVDAATYDNGDAVTVLGMTAVTGFVCWNTKADNSGNAYDVGDTFNIYQNTTLYAIWSA